MGPSTSHFKNYLANPNPNRFFLDPETPEEAHNIIVNLDKGKANASYDRL